MEDIKWHLTTPLPENALSGLTTGGSTIATSGMLNYFGTGVPSILPESVPTIGIFNGLEYGKLNLLSKEVI